MPSGVILNSRQCSALEQTAISLVELCSGWWASALRSITEINTKSRILLFLSHSSRADTHWLTYLNIYLSPCFSVFHFYFDWLTCLYLFFCYAHFYALPSPQVPVTLKTNDYSQDGVRWVLCIGFKRTMDDFQVGGKWEKLAFWDDIGMSCWGTVRILNGTGGEDKTFRWRGLPKDTEWKRIGHISSITSTWKDIGRYIKSAF